MLDLHSLWPALQLPPEMLVYKPVLTDKFMNKNNGVDN